MCDSEAQCERVPLNGVNSVCYSISKDKADPLGALQLPRRDRRRKVEKESKNEKERENCCPWGSG